MSNQPNFTTAAPPAANADHPAMTSSTPTAGGAPFDPDLEAMGPVRPRRSCEYSHDAYIMNLGLEAFYRKRGLPMPSVSYCYIEDEFGFSKLCKQFGV